MNPERRFEWVERLSNFLIGIQLKVENFYHIFFPEKRGRIMDLSEFEDINKNIGKEILEEMSRLMNRR